MKKLDDLYCQFLKVGFVVLRQAADACDPAWVLAEIELLHNIPSLIGERNAKRHAYFWHQERKAYVEWVIAAGKELPRSRMATYYEPIWKEMEGILLTLES